ncbi:DUF4197 domain-containing protein [Desulfovibrio mangrovi]|uniref:DUF4197 domain-containing protein n=1 Tax=Desulfovibrio mangrovi TaxID=2976983 RepID=UPI0022478D78|nr:DUF4197 domain-containing protein [Desulfovibrio mangrovi]UZP66107.1 DUF4197 domain-containing protein [Desulfovibrio mangrovi]
MQFDPRNYPALLAAIFLLVLSSVTPIRAGLLDAVKEQVLSGSTSTTTSSPLTDSEVIKGLKEALRKTVDNSVSMLGRDGGFLNTPSVRIPMPDSLRTAEQAARALGQNQLADEFIATMNHAAEQATKETASIFFNAISTMSFEDARAILNGPDDAATAFFRKTSTGDLTTRIRPIVEKATEATNVTASYKKFTGTVSQLNPLLRTGSADLDGYVTDKTVDGIFTIMAQEEAEIRANPAARTSDILKKVFGSVAR